MSLEDVLKSINKAQGAGSIGFLEGKATTTDNCISTGILSLDSILGNGIPRGRHTEIYGPASSGKTTLALTTTASAQRQGIVCAYIDTEHSVDKDWAEKLGVDLATLVFAQPDSGEQALNIAYSLITSGEIGLIVVDSIAMLLPSAEASGEMGDNQMGAQARLMNKAHRKLTPLIDKHNVAMIWINQIRMKIGVMFGSPETTPGGLTMSFAATCRVEVRRGEIAKVGEVATGHAMKCKTVKNKMNSPYQTCEVPLVYATGIDTLGDLANIAVAKGVVTKAGSWYKYKDQQIGQGITGVRAFLKSEPLTMDIIKQEVLTKEVSPDPDTREAA
jgi:recombination protein RecA